MGCDALDLTFEIEKTCHFKVERPSPEEFLKACETFHSKNWFGRTVERSDWKAGRFFEMVRDHSIPFCAKCRFILKGFPPAGQCPKCAMPCKEAVLSWENFQQALGKVLGKEPASITRELWLRHDLGFS